MKLIKKIREVYYFVKLDEFLFVSSDKNFNLEDNVMFIASKRLIKEIYYVYLYIDEVIKIFNKKTRKFDILYDGFMGIRANIKDKNKFLLSNKERSAYYLVKDFEIKGKYDTDKNIAIFYDDLCVVNPHFLKPQNQLSCYKLGDFDNKIWHFSLPEGFKIYGKIQLVENVLFFTAFKDVNKYENNYGIDIRTGNVLWVYNFKTPYDGEIIAYHINPENNLSYGYGGRLYQVFDPVNGKIVFEKDMSDYYEQGVEPDLHRNSISDGRLWFVSGYGENAKFGAININTHEVEFIQDYPLELDYRFHKIIFHQNKLYVSDSGNTLHIFEKTSDEQV